MSDSVSAANEVSITILFWIDTMHARITLDDGAMNAITGETGHAPPSEHYQDADSGIAVLLHGAPQVGENPVVGRQGSAGERIYQLYRAFGRDLLRHVQGQFSLCIIDPAERYALCAVDRIGRSTLYVRERHNGFSVAAHLSSITREDDFQPRIRPQSLYDYVFFHMIPSPDCIYPDVVKLQAGQCLEWRDGRTDKHFYWVPEFDEPSSLDWDASIAELHRLMGDSVAAEAGDDAATTGAFLSGGLDSSTVAGKLAKIFPGQANTFSIGFSAEGYDEIEYARIAATHFGNVAHEYYVTPDDVADFFEKIAEVYDEPFGNSSAVPTYFCARFARDNGIERLLGGDGGDELFAGNTRYAKQAVFELYGRLPSLLREGLLSPLLGGERRLPGPLGKLNSYVAQARVPLPDRLQSYNLLERVGIDTVFSPDFLATIDTSEPYAIMRDIYQRPAEASTLNRMLYLDWQQTLADNDLRKVTTMCELAGIDVRFPLLSDEIVDFSLRIPSKAKLRGKQLRYFYKRAVKGYLPDAILNKSKHGFGLPFGVWLRETPRLREIADESLRKLDQRGLFAEGFIPRIQHLHQNEHASFYGELIWILIILERWMENHGV